MTNKGLTEIPEELCALTHLTKLEMWGNRLEDLPSSFAQLSSLEHLDLTDNHFREIPSAVFELEELKVLMLPENLVCQVPEAIGRLRNLETLWLGENVESIDPAIGQLGELEELRVRSRGPISLPVEMGQLHNLRMLKLGECALPEFPRWILELTSLENLFLNDCGLREIPEGIRDLSLLQGLDLSNNDLSTLPDSLFELEALGGLYIYDNPKLPVITVPHGRLPNLQEIAQGDFDAVQSGEPVVSGVVYFPPENCFVGVPYRQTGAPLRQSSEDKRWHDLQVYGAPPGAKVVDLWMSGDRWISSLRVPTRDSEGFDLPMLAITSDFAKWTFLDLAPFIGAAELLSVVSAAISGESIAVVVSREMKSGREKTEVLSGAISGSLKASKAPMPGYVEVIEAPSGFVTYGMPRRGPARTKIFHSSEGVEWAEVGGLDGTFTLNRLNDTLIAELDGLFTSNDRGVTWDRVDIDHQMASAPAYMEGVVGPGGYAVSVAGERPGKGLVSRIWFSADGVNFSEVPTGQPDEEFIHIDPIGAADDFILCRRSNVSDGGLSELIHLRLPE